MRGISIIPYTLLLAYCQSAYGKSALLTKEACPPGPVPDGCPFPDHALSTFFPHANDCHWFFHCSNGVPYCKVCPANLHWNQALETCDYPERAGCSVGGGETTQKPNPPSTATPTSTSALPKPTTAEPKPTTEKPASPGSSPSPSTCPASAVPDCPFPDPALSVFFPHENDCHWFFHCSNGVAYCKKCPADLHWNPVLDTCDRPENAGCGVPKPTTSAPKPTTAAPKPTTEKPAPPVSTPSPSTCPAGGVPNCPFPDPAFSVFFPHENDCHWFFHCSNGVAYCKKCPADLHWNPVLDTCDRPEHAGCGSGSVVSTTKKPVPPTTAAPKPTTAAPKPTTNKPATPSTSPSVSICPAGAIPNCPFPDPALSVFFPHENDCHWFYHCSNGVAYCKKCPAGLHWNPVLNTCDRPEHAGCNSESGLSTTKKPSIPSTSAPQTTSVAPPSTSYPFSCPAGKVPNCPFPDPALSVFFPHENDSRWFYHCSNGVAYCKVCPFGLHWNANLDTCDWPEHVRCRSGGLKTVHARSTDVTEKSDSSIVSNKESVARSKSGSTECPPGNQPKCPSPFPGYISFFPHENDCQSYFYCKDDGNPVCMHCPSGLHWNQDLQSCDWPDHADCDVDI